MTFNLSRGVNNSIAMQRGTLFSYSGHTRDEWSRPQASFGIRDRYTSNVDFKFLLFEQDKCIVVWINGLLEKRIRDPSLTKEWLASKSKKYVTDLGR